MSTASKSFQQSWAALDAKGAMSAEYAMFAAQFVEACAAAYRAGFSADALDVELAFLAPSSIDATERAVRRILMELVFYTLEKLNFPRNGRLPALQAPSKLSEEVVGLRELCEHVIAAEERGYDVGRLRLELAVASGASRSDEEAEMLAAWLVTCFATIRLVRANA